MKFTLDWLNQYTDLKDLDPDELVERLTMLGLEVDSVTPLHKDLQDLKTAKVLETAKHPNADKLTLCQVAVGDDIHKIVCGAPNVRPGLCTVIALPGTVLPGNIKIKKSKVRGEESAGMLCSERELGISDCQQGIMELPEDTPHGQPFTLVTGLADTMIEVDLTPNRPDCASVIGIAREVAGFTGRKLQKPVEYAEIKEKSSKFTVAVNSPELCSRYAARLITGVKIAPSPFWLRKRLLSVGLRPVNNVVDITNFVMLEYGQPLHAFDFDQLVGRKIIVRTPNEGEEIFTTLDNMERKIDQSDLLICDAEKPVALAGIMGGLNSEVSETTVNVLLESACFDAVSVRKTARKMGLSTDASYRFERGVDPDGVVTAMARAAELLCEIAGGHAEPAGADIYPGKTPSASLVLRVSRTSELLGLELDKKIIKKHLESIGLVCEDRDEDTLLVTPPSFRIDIEREADLVEEVARLVGYDAIPTSLPEVKLSYPARDAARHKRCQSSDYLAAIGFSEVINYSFVSEKHGDALLLDRADQRRKVVRLLNPLTEEQSVMRTMLLPGLLENIKRNNNFQQYSLKLFELGTVFSPSGDDQQPRETNQMAGVISGSRHGANNALYFKDEPADIFDLKGVVEGILQNLRLWGVGDDLVHFVQPPLDRAEPYAVSDQFLVIEAGKEILGSLGKCKNEVLQNFGIKQDVYYFELNYDALCSLREVRKKFSPLPVFPAASRDIALILPEQVSAGEMLEAIENSRDKLIESCRIFDVYQGKPIELGCKSVAISITYRSAARTLTDKQVDKSHHKIVKMLTERFGGKLRE
ncbi:MAG: phenylalanine--tRNA ligase subunit beta [Deltaproteobacteria bacterium]|nr:MAG: phenylalanine--tRNA ligase subunit beta [Deltaproteobacteria bacterium]